MSTLVLIHVVTGLAGIVSGAVVVGGILAGRATPRVDAVFLLTTFAPCATGFAFLPTDGLTSAQLVSFFLTFLLAVAAYARYVRRLDSGWKQVYALTAVGALFLNALITNAQSFLHLDSLRALAPTAHSPLYLAAKFTLLFAFIAIALLATRRAGRADDARRGG